MFLVKSFNSLLIKIYLFYSYGYCYLLLFLFSSVLMSLLLLGLTFLFSKKMKSIKKNISYECGFNSYSSASVMFYIHFFMVGLLFLVFDMELVFLYPLSLVYYYMNYTGVLFIHFFLIIIVIGYLYEWQKGALNWTVLHE